MVTFGIELIQNFSKSRKNGIKITDRPGAVVICDKFDKVLRKARHMRDFYYLDDTCEEKDIRATEFNGTDNSVVDNVDLFFISTHGGHDDEYMELCFDNKNTDWTASSKYWKLGDRRLKWLMMNACSTIEKKNYYKCWNVFSNLHEICGAYGKMVRAPSTVEIGEDIAENLIDGKTVADAWLNGVSDWAHNNHPIVVAADDDEGTLNILERDHLPGHGYSIPDNEMKRANILTAKWVEGSVLTTFMKELF
ncbi:MAG: DUF6345 domain-containing protein [Nitrososphaeraceae archaeon]